jgi:hypothetical protein
MSAGFGAEKIKSGEAKIIINDDEVNKLLKRYKKIKKYMKSPLYTVKTIDGTEEVVSSLIKEATEDPVD